MSEMNVHEKRARLEELNHALDGTTSYEPSIEGQLLHEALALCTDLGLDRAWVRFKALLERLQQSELEKKRLMETEDEEGY